MEVFVLDPPKKVSLSVCEHDTSIGYDGMNFCAMSNFVQFRLVPK